MLYPAELRALDWASIALGGGGSPLDDLVGSGRDACGPRTRPREAQSGSADDVSAPGTFVNLSFDRDAAERRATLRRSRITGFILLALHTLATACVFLTAHLSDDGQTVFLYFPFYLADAPFVPLALLAEWKFGFLDPMTEWWYSKGHQGINLREFVLIGVFGGLQWFLLGCALVRCKAWLRQRSRNRRSMKSSRTLPSDLHDGEVPGPSRPS